MDLLGELYIFCFVLFLLSQFGCILLMLSCEQLHKSISLLNINQCFVTNPFSDFHSLTQTFEIRKFFIV